MAIVWKIEISGQQRTGKHKYMLRRQHQPSFVHSLIPNPGFFSKPICFKLTTSSGQNSTS